MYKIKSGSDSEVRGLPDSELPESHQIRYLSCTLHRECAKYTYTGLRGLDEEIVTGQQREENVILLAELRNGKFSSDKVSKN